MYTKHSSNNFKYVIVFLGNGSNFGSEWMYMLDDGTPVPSWDLIVEDEEDEKAAKSFGWTEEEIDNIRVR